jgi:hypothetical protein
MTKFAIDDRLADVNIHLSGRFDPRHLGTTFAWPSWLARDLAASRCAS